jgi:hypothetical protein
MKNEMVLWNFWDLLPGTKTGSIVFGGLLRHNLTEYSINPAFEWAISKR